LHIGWIFASFAAWRFVKQNNWIFLLRIEDTDQKRQVDWAVESLLDSMKTFWITINEWNIWIDWSDVW
jgi:glutamyl-tRNA synthetase